MKSNTILKRIGAFILLVVMAFSVTACSRKAIKKTKIDTVRSFEQICEECFLKELKDEPLGIYFFIKNRDNYDFDLSEDDLSLKFGDEKIDDEQSKYYKGIISELEAIDRETLTEKQKISYDAILWALRESDNDVPFYMSLALDPSNGVIPDISTNFTEFIIENESDAKDYLVFVKNLPKYGEEIIDFAKKQAKEGYAPTDYVYEKNIETCNDIINADINPFVACFDEKMDLLDLPSDKKKEYKKLNQEYYDKYIATMYNDLITAFNSLKGSGKNKKGLYGFGKDGKDYYQTIIKSSTSTDMSGDELYQYLSEKVDSLFYTYYSIAMNNPKLMYEIDSIDWKFDSPEGILDDILATMDSEFYVPHITNYELSAINKACEIDGVLAYYLRPRIDDLYTNKIRINMSSFDKTDVMSYVTIAHEGIPGHMYQYTETYRDEDVPNLKKILSFLGETEGWAEYAAYESLHSYALRNNISEEAVNFNIMYYRFAYCLEALMDVCVNYKGMSAKELGDKFSQYGVNTNNINKMYDTFISSPGRLLPYAVGCEKMYDLQSKVIDELGESYIKGFNQYVIEVGPVPFTILEELVDAWIGKQK